MTENPYPMYDPESAALYTRKRWWLGMTISDVLDKNADLYPDREAMVGQGRRFTHAQLRAEADRIACGLIKLGLQKGDRVMLQLPNWPEFILAHYALQKAGLVMVLLTVNHTAREIAHLAELTQPRGWILPVSYRKTDYETIVRMVQEKVNTINNLIMVGETVPDGCVNFRDLSQGAPEAETMAELLETARPDPENVCYLLPTGGTTNLPKCAVRTHNDYLVNVEYVSRAWDVHVKDTCLVGTTVGHNLALLVTISGAIFQGAKIVLLDSSLPKDFCRMVEEEKVTCTGLVPTLVSRFVSYDELTQHDFSSLERVYVGAANSPPELVKRVESRMGSHYVNAFGMVEGPCSQTRPGDPFEVRTQTIGRPVCPYDDFCTLDNEGNKTAPGVEGEMAAKGPGIFAGYYRNPQTNKFAFTPDGYFRTGDLAIIDEKGHIRITGRIKDIIIRGGENISARDVEDIISSHPAVEYVAAVGMPDEEFGEQVFVFIKPNQGAQITHQDIVDHMESYGSAKALIPVCSEMVEKLPLTAAGKVDKKVLRQQLADQNVN